MTEPNGFTDLEYRGYRAVIVFDNLDQLYHGKIHGIRDSVSFEGENMIALERDFHEAVDDYIKIFATKEKESKRTMTEPNGFPDLSDDDALAVYTQMQHINSVADRNRQLLLPPEPGRHTVPMADYRAWDAVSASLLHDLAPPTGSAEKALDRRTRISADTDSTLLGTAIHAAVLEPNDFDRDWLVTPTRGGGLKAWKAEAVAAGKHFISQTQMDIARTARDQVYAHPLACNLLAGLSPVHVEQSLVWDLVVPNIADDPVQLVGKCRGDLCRDDLGIWGDIKTTRDIRADRWAWQAADLGYDITKAWYEAGCRAQAPTISEYFFIVIQNDFPCAVEIFEMGPSSATLGRDRMNLALRRWATLASGKLLPEQTEEARVRPVELPERAFNAFYVEGREMSA